MLKDYILLHYFALGTLSTTGVHIFKYLLTQIPCCILICVMLCDVFTAVKTKCFILYCIIMSYIHVMTWSTSLFWNVCLPLPCATMCTQQCNTIPKLPPIACWKKKANETYCLSTRGTYDTISTLKKSNNT